MTQSLSKPTTSSALAQQVNSHLDLVSAHILEQINVARKELDKLENEALTDISVAKKKVEIVIETASVVVTAALNLAQTAQHLASMNAKPIERIEQHDENANGEH